MGTFNFLNVIFEPGCNFSDPDTIKVVLNCCKS